MGVSFSTDDTIVAIATPVGRAGLGVVRISGRSANEIAERLLGRRRLEARRATLTSVRDLTHPAGASADRQESPRALDRVVATFFPGPGSFTGEDTIELSAHGSPVVLEGIVASAMRAGARLAQPGEFTLRAYLNGRLDLVQAEAVADLVEAVTPGQARQAFDQLAGTLTQAIARIEERLFSLRVRLEASLDFPDEGYHFVGSGEAERELVAVRREIQKLLETGRRGRMIREGRPVVLLGGPNAGKSSLFNALVGVDRAIVTPIAGTTRDLVTERADIGGVPMTLVDTAGLRADPEEVEREGIARAKAAIAVAALVLVVLDRSRPLADGQAGLEASHGRDRLLVGTKSDLPAVWECASATERTLFVSSVTGEGVPELRAAMLEVLSGREEDTDVPIVSNVRHIGLLEEAQGCLDRAIEQAAQSAPEELILADLLAAGAALEDVLGRRTAEDVLTAIFAKFCIGK